MSREKDILESVNRVFNPDTGQKTEQKYRVVAVLTGGRTSTHENYVGEWAEKDLTESEVQTALYALSREHPVDIHFEAQAVEVPVTEAEKTEEEVAAEMQKKGYKYFVQLDGEDRYLYFKSADEVGPFMREEFPNRKIVKSGPIEKITGQKMESSQINEGDEADQQIRDMWDQLEEKAQEELGDRFMEPEFTVGQYALVDGDMGIYLFPDVDERDVAVELYSDHTGGEAYDRDDAVEFVDGYYARLSASGYMDATDWTPIDSTQDVEDFFNDYVFMEARRPSSMTPEKQMIESVRLEENRKQDLQERMKRRRVLREQNAARQVDNAAVQKRQTILENLKNDKKNKRPKTTQRTSLTEGRVRGKKQKLTENSTATSSQHPSISVTVICDSREEAVSSSKKLKELITPEPSCPFDYVGKPYTDGDSDIQVHEFCVSVRCSTWEEGLKTVMGYLEEPTGMNPEAITVADDTEPEFTESVHMLFKENKTPNKVAMFEAARMRRIRKQKLTEGVTAVTSEKPEIEVTVICDSREESVEAQKTLKRMITPDSDVRYVYGGWFSSEDTDLKVHEFNVTIRCSSYDEGLMKVMNAIEGTEVAKDIPISDVTLDSDDDIPDFTESRRFFYRENKSNGTETSSSGKSLLKENTQKTEKNESVTQEDGTTVTEAKDTPHILYNTETNKVEDEQSMTDQEAKERNKSLRSNKNPSRWIRSDINESNSQEFLRIYYAPENWSGKQGQVVARVDKADAALLDAGEEVEVDPQDAPYVEGESEESLAREIATDLRQLNQNPTAANAFEREWRENILDYLLYDLEDLQESYQTEPDVSQIFNMLAEAGISFEKGQEIMAKYMEEQSEDMYTAWQNLLDAIEKNRSK